MRGVLVMKTIKQDVIKIECDDMYIDTYFIYNRSMDAAVLCADGRYRCSIYGCSLETLKDVAVFWGWNPDRPNSYLARKYHIEDDDIFGGVMSLKRWFDILYDLGVLKEDTIVEFGDDLETAFNELF